MALTPEQQATVTEIAALCENPKDKDTLAEVLARNEAAARGLYERGLRQSDYDRLMNTEKAKIASREKELTESITQYKDLYTANKKWKTDNEGKVLAANNTIAELQKQIKEAANRAVGEGGEVTPEQVKQLVDDAVKASGGLTPDVVTKMVSDAVAIAKQEGQKEFVEQTLPLQTAFAMDMVEVNVQHEKEFGAFLPRKEFSDFCNEHGYRDPKTAYEAFVKDARHKKEVEKASLEAADKARKEQEEADNKKFAATPGVPGAGAGPEGMGVMQSRIEQARQAGNVVAGGAAAAAAEVRQRA